VVRGLVVTPEDDDELGPLVDAAVARLWDAYWAKYVMAPFTWQRYLGWWIARRWIVPRDIRRT
jgi:hypothetical protein